MKTHQVDEKTDQSDRKQGRNPCQRRLRFELRIAEIKTIDAVPQNDSEQDKVKDAMEEGRAGKYDEETVISLTDAIIKPLAVMIETLNTAVTGSTMFWFLIKNVRLADMTVIFSLNFFWVSTTVSLFLEHLVWGIWESNSESYSYDPDYSQRIECYNYWMNEVLAEPVEDTALENKIDPG